MRLFSILHNIGLIFLLVTGFIMLVALNHSFIIRLLFSLGVLQVTIGRFFGEGSDYSLSSDCNKSLSVRRLHRQRLVAVCILWLSVVLLFIDEGFYWGYYIRRSLWFLPFLIFTIIEVYSIFRLSWYEKSLSDHTKTYK